jgi:tetratricopeptide (TPR) repeat protein
MPRVKKTKSKEVIDLKINLHNTKGFLEVVKKIDSLPDMQRTAYSETRSLYQTVSKGKDLNVLTQELEEFFGQPVKPAGKSMPFMLRFNPSIKYLGGVREDQLLFIKKVKAGFYYGALWPWKREPDKVTVHLGFCSHKMSDKDFKQLKELVKSKVLHEKVFEKFDAHIGTQVYGISLASFLQMASMEKISCRLIIQAADKTGDLDILNGDLIAAETAGLTKKVAAAAILSWDDALIEIEQPSGKKENEINQPIVQLLVDALKIRTKEAPGKKRPKVSAKAPKGTAAEALPEPAAEVPILKSKRFLKIAATLLVAGAVALGTVVASRIVKARSIKKEYQNVLAQIESQPEPEQKITLLQHFVNAHQQSEYAKNAQDKINEVRMLFEKQSFKTVVVNADKLLADNDYEKAMAVYREYLEKYPQSMHVTAIKKKTAEIIQQVDDRDYHAVVKTAGGDGVERILSYVQYLEKYPNGKHRDEVNKLIADMGAEYYRFFEKQITICQNQEDWEQCIQLSDTFINIYPGHGRANEIKSFIALFQKELQEKKTMDNLMQKAARVGGDYKAARQIYFDYLDSQPDSPLKDKIITELTKLKKQEELARLQSEREKITALLQESKGRFVDKGNDTVTDTKTGLTWSMLDSLQELKKCLSYESAVKYVQDLRTGGYQDWRLPNESELTGIYKTKPFFPPKTAEWFWTSKSYSRYSDGWQMMVFIVTTKRETEWNKEQTYAQECGAVHAVRP